MGLLFGSAGAHTYVKSGQVAPPQNSCELIQDNKKGPLNKCAKFH